MIFSAILGVGSALLGASSSNKASKRASADARAAQQSQERIANRQLAFAESERADRQRELDYQREVETLNRGIAQEDYDFQLAELRAMQSQLLEERQFQIDRQIQVDRAAAEQRALELEQLLNNQSITSAERARALTEMEEAQAIARGERDEDLRRFAEEREMKSIERDFMVSQFYAARDQAMAERNDDLAYRDAIFGRVGDLQSALDNAQRGLGELPVIPSLSMADIDAEIASRTADYIGDADRAIDRVASVNEANLIRSGMDESTPGTRRRTEIASEAASLYDEARRRARDEALGYIGGRQGLMVDNANARMGQRGAVLNEVGQVAGAGLDTMLRVPTARGASSIYGMASSLPSGIHSRGISSANDYRAPLAVNSGIYDNLPNSLGVGPDVVTRSGTNGMGVGLARTLVNPYGQGNFNPGGALAGAASTAASMAATAQAAANQANANASLAGQALGSAVSDLGSSLDNTAFGKRASSWFSNIGGGGGKGGKG